VVRGGDSRGRSCQDQCENNIFEGVVVEKESSGNAGDHSARGIDLAYGSREGSVTRFIERIKTRKEERHWKESYIRQKRGDSMGE